MPGQESFFDNNTTQSKALAEEHCHKTQEKKI
jgi:hypothetical protein